VVSFGNGDPNRHPMKPNILFIMTDDQAPWTLGVEGHPNACTPVLDRLAGPASLAA